MNGEPLPPPTGLSVAKRQHAATTVGDYALFGGGSGGTNATVIVEAYDKSLTRTSAPNLSVGRWYLTATTIGDFALFAGGDTSLSPSYSKVVDAYDTSLTRTTANEMSAGRYYLAATTVGDYALFGGGRGADVRSAAVDVYTIV